MDLGDNRFLNWIFCLRNGLWCALRSYCNDHTSQFVHTHYPDYIIHQSAGQLSDEPASWGGRLNGCFLAQAWLVRQENLFRHLGGCIWRFPHQPWVFSARHRYRMPSLFPRAVSWFSWPHCCMCKEYQKCIDFWCVPMDFFKPSFPLFSHSIPVSFPPSSLSLLLCNFHSAKDGTQVFMLAI